MGVAMRSHPKEATMSKRQHVSGNVEERPFRAALAG